MRGPIARATLRTSAVLGLRLLAQAATLLIVARLLGPVQFGAFVGMAALAVMFGALSTFGTHLLLLREVSRAPDKPPQWLPIAFAATLLCGTALLLVYLAVTMLWLSPAGMSAVALLAIAISDIVVLPLLALPAVLRQGQGQIARAQVLVVLPQVMRLIAASTVMLWHPDAALTVYALAYALAALACLPIAWHTLPAGWAEGWRWTLPSWTQWREASGYAVLNLSALGPNELDKTLAVHLLPAAAAGTYAAGSRVLGPLVLPVLAMMISALPRMFRTQDEPSNRSRLLRVTLFIAMAYGLLAGVALWVAAPVIAWAFGERYADLVGTLHWLAFAVPGLSMRYVISNILMTSDQPLSRVVIELFGLFILWMVAIFAEKYGAAGMAGALVCAEWGMVLFGITLFRGNKLPQEIRRLTNF